MSTTNMLTTTMSTKNIATKTRQQQGKDENICCALELQLERQKSREKEGDWRNV